MPHEEREALGTVVLAQEDRLRLQTPDGRSLLFTLNGAGASISLERLAAMARLGSTVRVRYRGEPESGAVVLAVQVD